ncbi:MAG: DUF445 domain-containing protein [Solirubrobacterales bacterium]
MIDWVSVISVPFFTGAIGYVTNWSGVIMLFQPVRFRGARIPLLGEISRVLPRKIQQIPGIMQGGIGWQGIIPSRAAKMGSIAVDKGIAKLGSPKEFYDQLEPDKIAAHILETSRRDIRDVVERIMERENPQLWNELPPRVREAVHERVQEQLPDIVRTVTDEIGTHIDQLLDIKLMVIRRFEEDPSIAVQIFRDIGTKELKFIVNFGFFFGFLLGIPVAVITEILFHQWWLLPLSGVIIGYVTNLVAIWMIFEPVKPTKIGPFTIQGLFLKRQPEAGDVYAKAVADDVVTLSNIGNELLHGPRSDRTRQMIERALRPALDRAVGRPRAAVRAVVGGREYDAIREAVAVESVEYAVTPMSDPEFNRAQGERVRTLIAERIREMPPDDFSEMLRTAIKEDEWLLYLHGAVLGFAAGLVHLGIFG